MNARTIDMSGRRYASLIAIRPTGKAASGDLLWLFACDCGNEFEANGYYARSGKIITCQKCSKERVRAASVKHGLSETVEFFTWTDIQTRCHNPNSTSYESYGGRGIHVCKRWRDSFEDFLSDMGLRPSNAHSIDRINNDGDYEPANCRWATREEQANNKRNNVMVTIGEETKTLSSWCKQFGVQTGTASLRYKKGYRGSALFETTTKKVSINGISDTVRGWSKRTGIKVTTIHQRIYKYKWPVERALTEGVKN